MRKLIYLVATTLDGYIADEDGGFDFFANDPDTLSEIFAEYPETCPAHVREVLGITTEARHFDTVIMGRRTHSPALEAGLTSAYPHLQQFVVTQQRDLPTDPTVTFIHDGLVDRVRALKREPGLGIWLCGGGNLAAQLVDEIDEFHLKVNPVMLGRGVPLLDARLDPMKLKLASTRTFAGGVLLNTYIPWRPLGSGA